VLVELVEVEEALELWANAPERERRLKRRVVATVIVDVVGAYKTEGDNQDSRSSDYSALCNGERCKERDAMQRCEENTRREGLAAKSACPVARRKRTPTAGAGLTRQDNAAALNPCFPMFEIWLGARSLRI